MDYVFSLTDDELQRKVKPSFWDDDDPPITVAQALTQVINHSTDHRAQTMAVLHTMGYDGVGQDFLSYLHEKIKEK
ncbi:MAG: DinB family protein [Chloroflexota bacterium]